MRLARHLLLAVAATVLFMYGIGVLDRIEFLKPPQPAVLAPAAPNVAELPTSPASNPDGGGLSSDVLQTTRDFKSVADQWEDLFHRMLPELYRQRATIRKLKRELTECRNARVE